jgi:DNA segregation ATPase FtsK/SpoIIIE-like protein
MNEPIYIDRPPRIQPTIPFDEIEIPSPPNTQEVDQGRLFQIALPIVSVIGFVLVGAFGGSGRGLFMIPMALAVLGSTIYAIYSFRKQKQRRAEIIQGYKDRLIELNREMQNYHDMQRRAYRYNYPDPHTALRIVQHSRRDGEKTARTLRSEARLWERRVADDDFGFVRLGLGARPSTVTYVLGDVDTYDDPLVRDAMKLADDSRFVNQAPIVITLRQPKADDEDEEGSQKDDEQAPQPPFTHALGIAGEQSSVYQFVRSLVGHYVVFHAPMDARLYILASEKREWAWTEQLPHCQGDEQSKPQCFVNAIGEQKADLLGDDDGNELDQFLEGIRKILAQRKIQLQEHNENAERADPTKPLLLVVIDLLDATYDDSSPLRKIEADSAISIILEEGASLGAAAIFLVPERSKVPSGCRSVIEIEKTSPATSSRSEPKRRLHFRFAETGVNSYRYVGEADCIAEPQVVERLAEDLAELRVRQSAGANLANSVPFLDLMGFQSINELKAATWRNWQNSVRPEQANWLRVKFGLMSGNKPRTLVLSAKRDGVHGMVAGSTGSGKSELLISLITGLVTTYDPTVLNFVLVDYKGGSAFNEFKGRLPHCVDVITNLGEEGVTRMFTAIRAELERRQALNSSTNTKNIVDYRQRGYHLTHAPYPYLFIIIDEFAEMIADRAEYKAQLETITRVGRAQGVSLILAAQRPSGVTDQMRSNIKFRICLRVETPGESREMLRRSDAAFLPAGIPGRGYLQVGNEEIELVQVAYTGDRYAEAGQAAQAKVIWPDRGGQEVVPDQEPPELYIAIIDLLQRMAQEHGVKRQRAPWPDALPQQLWLSQMLISQDPRAKTITSIEYLEGIDQITLGQPAEASLSLNPAINQWFRGDCGWFETLDWKNYALRPVVGLVDNPYAAKQLPLIVDFLKGHVVVFGASGYGKTTFIRTLIASLAATHSPDHFHAYLLDLGGRNLDVLKDLPHVGAFIMPDEEGYEERVAQLLREIDDSIETRKTLLNNARVSNIFEYNQTRPAMAQPAILVAIDNFVEFLETFGGDSDASDNILNRFIGIARQGKAYGIHFIISVNQLGNLSNQLYSLFTERFALKLADPSEYRAIVGEQAPPVSDVPGRGYAKIDRRALGFQVATVAKPENELKRLEELAAKINTSMRSGRTYNLPVRVDALPKSVLFTQLLARQHQLELDASFLQQLEQVMQRQWMRSVDPQHADWLQVTIGVVSGDRPRPLLLEAKKDGVHGMIAGGTGAGKSELLMTLIVGLALNYDPSVLNFLLVDYKGGGAFKPFENLPHVVNMITNLNKAAVRRVFTTIAAEMQRRQRLNAETGTKDIVEYRARGLHQTREPYPHLFIIIDEYAEMITESPEFREELDSITRVGRAQGVNLLLASQRPVGVSDQMRANIKLRICLRVEEADTSREMLRRPDAAFLPNGMPGRGYLQVGNEHLELMQTAYTGETYQYAEAPEGGEKPKFYDVVIKLANTLLRHERPQTPWPPPLPAALTLSEPLSSRYLDQAYQPLITLGRTERLAPNPFVQDWLDGAGTWHGIDWNKAAMRAIVGVLDDPYNASQLPLIVDFTKGHAIIFGAAGWGKTTLLRSLIVSLASTHSPNEFQSHVLDLGGRNLEVLRALPHVGTIIIPDERGYEERVQQIWRELNDIVDHRKKLFSEAGVANLYEYNNSQPAQIEPAILVAIDNFTEYLETFGNATRADDPNNLLEIFVTLARQGKAYGLHFVITVNRLNAVSSKLYSLFTERLTLRLADASEYSAIVGSQVPEIEEIPGRGYTRVRRAALAFQVGLMPGAIDSQGQVGGETRFVRNIGEHMTAYVRNSPQRYQNPLCIDALPTSSSYRQLLADELQISQDNKVFLTEFKAAMLRTWERNASAEHADWLYAPLGVTSGNRVRTLRLEAKRDGAHGMIAGGTGSGKSELLMTMIVGLAVNFSPDILNFVLVDYKGGGAFKPFERLPHCVDIVTNLNKAAVDRMFTAISAEIRRRQALNAETGTKDIIEYRRKGLHKTRQPYPHLFIIIDEYSEMIDDNPEYRQALDSITRVGRAQGVNLILASQQPKGVSDQMRANIKLRLCLRVEQVDTSRELLRRPDAALLPNGVPGRGYLQVGNENLELVQVSYSGESQPDERDAPVLWPDRPTQDAQRTGDETPRLFDAVVALAFDLYGSHMARKPWPGFLPETFSLESPLVDAQQNRTFRLEPAITSWINGDTGALWPGVDWLGGVRPAARPIVGLLDNPAEAQQEPLRFDLGRSHLAVFGDSGLGKSTFLRTLLVSLAATHSPGEMHAYVLDLGGRNLRSLEELPHTGTVIYADEETFEERLQRLLERLERLSGERQQILSTSDVGSLYEYNARFPAKALPIVVVLIDNFAELQENYDSLVETTLMPLVRGSLSVGITFVVTANIPTNMPSKLYNLFGERITFKQSNADRYLDIVGRGAIEIGDLPGRGYVRRSQRPLTFHIAQPLGIPDHDGRYLRPEAEELRLMASQMNDYLAIKGIDPVRPDRIETLPDLVRLEEILQVAEPAGVRRIQAVLGKDNRLLPALIDLKRMGPHFCIVGPPLSGKTTALYNWVLSVAERYPPDRAAFVLIDLQGRLFEYGGKRKLGELPHVISSISDVAQLDELTAQLKTECEALAAQGVDRAVYIIIDNFDDFSEELEGNQSGRNILRDLAGLARRYGRDGLHFVISGMLDGTTNELRKRVQSAGYGLGLRTEQALSSLRVQRTPAALRNKELPVGRGYIVKAGQPALLQVATPYESNGHQMASGDDGDEAAYIAAALDAWVERLGAKYPRQQAAWASANGAPPSPQVASPQQSKKLNQMQAILRRGVRQEVTSLKQGNGQQSLLMEQLVQSLDRWNDEEVVVKLLRELCVKQHMEMGLDKTAAEQMTAAMNEDSLLLMLEGSLPAEDDGGA